MSDLLLHINPDFHWYFSIDTMSEIMRHAIEAGSKLKEEVILQQDDFIVNQVSILHIQMYKLWLFEKWEFCVVCYHSVEAIK